MSDYGTAIVNRYGDAYIVARTINGFGMTVKTIGIVIGCVIVLASFGMAKGVFGAAAVLMGIVMGSVIATVLFLFGTLASAQGQILKAALDTAVNTSRWLSDEERARVMSLPVVSAATPAGAHAEWRCRCGQKNPAGAGACLECGTAA